MQLLHVDEIIIPPDRARKDFNADSLRELRISILEQGLFHPLLLRGDARTLVAGERRLRVLRDLYFENCTQLMFDGTPLPLGKVPCVVVGSDDELDLLKSELDENRRRSDLTWQEETQHVCRIHELEKARNPAQTIVQTQEKYRVQNPSVMGRMLALKPFLEDPDVAKASTLDEGLKIIERKLEQGHREAIARKFGGKAANELHTLILGDCTDIMVSLDAGTYDCIIADPPYGVNAGDWANMSAAAHTYEDTEDQSNALYERIAAEGFRLCKPQAHAYVFCDTRRAREVMSIFSTAGWRVWPWTLIFWRGPANGVCPWPEHGPRRTFEGIVFAIKGDRRTLGVFPDVLAHFDRDDEERGAHKPAALYADLLSRSCLPGDRVLDPCLGVGAILDAATGKRIHVTGIEISPAAFGRAKERLK